MNVRLVWSRTHSCSSYAERIHCGKWINILASILATLKPPRSWTGLHIPCLQKGKCMVLFCDELWLFLALLKVGDGQAAYLHSKRRVGKGSKTQRGARESPSEWRSGLTRKSAAFPVETTMSCNKSGWVGWGERRLERIEPKWLPHSRELETGSRSCWKVVCWGVWVAEKDITPHRVGRELHYLDSSFQYHQVQNVYGSEHVDLTGPSYFVTIVKATF